MANVKQVHIEARVSFDWVTTIEREDAAFVASWLMGPTCGLRYWYAEPAGFANENGGTTMTYLLTIAGHEAIAWPGYERLLQILASHQIALRRTLTQRMSRRMVASCIDIEDVA